MVSSSLSLKKKKKMKEKSHSRDILKSLKIDSICKQKRTDHQLQLYQYNVHSSFSTT